MTDPKRWSEAGDSATLDEQALVQAGRDLRMPSQEKSAVWQRIIGAIPAPPAPPVPPAATESSAIGSAAVPAATKGSAVGSAAPLMTPAALKLTTLIVALVGGGLIAHRMGWLGTTHERHSESNAFVATATKPSTVAASASAPRPDSVAAASTTNLATAAFAPDVSAPVSSTAVAAAPVATAPVPSVAVATNASNAAASTSVPGAGVSANPGTSSPASRLREESQAVLAVREALHSNNVSGALSLLQNAQRRFGAGALSEERTALLIEALARSGDTARAAKHAKAFLSAYPRSPHAADVQRHLQP